LTSTSVAVVVAVRLSQAHADLRQARQDVADVAAPRRLDRSGIHRRHRLRCVIAAACEARTRHDDVLRGLFLHRLNDGRVCAWHRGDLRHGDGTRAAHLCRRRPSDPDSIALDAIAEVRPAQQQVQRLLDRIGAVDAVGDLVAR
jgi:hypothetical protein